MQAKTPSQTETTMTEMVLPNDTNPLKNLMGGKIMHYMDIAGAIVAQKHSNCPVVTASVDNISFKKPISLGSVVTIKAKITRAFTSSMEVRIDVYSEYIPNNEKFKSHEAYFTYVALNKDTQKPIRVPQLTAETPQEIKEYNNAAARRTLRLLMAGRISPDEVNIDFKQLVIQ